MTLSEEKLKISEINYNILKKEYIKLTADNEELMQELDDLKNENKTLSRDFFIVSVLLLISIALVVVG